MHTMIEMLEGFIESYLNKTKELFNITFGFFIGNKDWYTVSIKSDGTYAVLEEKPTISTFYVIADKDTIDNIYTGKMHFLTAAGRANMSDYAPLDVRFLNGYQFDFDWMDFFSRFFILGEPEQIRFGKEFARIIHGGYAIPMVYSKGIRTGWYRVEPGLIINEKEDDQMNPFDTFVIGIKGKGIAKLNGTEYPLEAGNSFIIPKGMSHSFYSDYEEGLEFIIIMYGEGA